MAGHEFSVDEPSCPQCAAANERADYAIAEMNAALARVYDLEARQDGLHQKSRQLDNLMATLDRAGGALTVKRQPDGSIMVTRPS